MGGMTVTSAAIATHDAATQARARTVLAQLAEVHRVYGARNPIAYSSRHWATAVRGN